MRMRVTQFVAATMILGLAIAGCSTRSSSDGKGAAASGSFVGDSAEGVTSDTITMGWMGALTGLSASTLAPINAGVQAYYDYANKQGGVDGHKLKLISLDDQGVASTGIANFSQLVNDDHILAFAGMSGTQITEPLIPQITKYKVPVIGPSATVSDQLKNPYFWNTLPDYADQADIALAYAGQQVGGTDKVKAVTVTLAVPSGQEWQEDIKSKVTEAGGTFAGTYQLATTSPDATPIALGLQQQIKSGAVNYLFIHGNSETALTLFGAMSQFGVTLPSVGIYGIGTSKTFTASAPALSSKAAFVTSFTPPSIDTPGMTTLRNAAKGTDNEQYVTSDNVNFVTGWVNGMVSVEAIKRAAATGTLNRASLQKALGTIKNFDTGDLSTPIDFTRTGHNGGAVCRPYTYSNGFKAVGTYASWAKDIKGVYS